MYTTMYTIEEMCMEGSPAQYLNEYNKGYNRDKTRGLTNLHQDSRAATST